MRLERTAIYILSSIVTALGGVLVLLATHQSPIGLSIGTSLIAGSLSSIAFVTIRYFDDTDVERIITNTASQFADSRRSLQAIDQSLSSLRHSLSTDVSGRWRVFDRHPKEEVGDEIANVHGHVDIDVAGLTLRPFCRDWLATIMRRGDVRLRLLIQDPTSVLFTRVCHQESRDTETMLEDARWVTRALLDLEAGKPIPGWDEVTVGQGLKVEIRWFVDYPTVTITRVGDIIFARARFLREGASHTRTFFERYTADDAATFETFRSYFEIAWESARTPTLEDCMTISAPRPEV